MDGQAAPLIDPQSLPAPLVPTVLQQAGLHTRLVCRAYRDLHPHLLALTPHSLYTPEALKGALSTLPPTLTSLDLSGNHQSSGSYGTPPSLTPTALAAIPSTLPSLRCLHLPALPSNLLPALFTTLHACPHLHTLSIDDLHFQDPPSPSLWQDTLLHPPFAARLRSLTLPGTVFTSTLATAPAGALPHLTAFQLSCPASHPSPGIHGPHLAALAAAAPALQSLQLHLQDSLQDPDHLIAFHALAELTVKFSCFNGPPGLLPHIGSLVSLRRLRLHFETRAVTPAGTGWLARLMRLTHLSLKLRDENDMDSTKLWLEGVACAAATHLPLLHSLYLGIPSQAVPMYPADWLPAGKLAATFSYLAAATQLRRLSLEGLPLPPADAHVLSSLQGLTALLLDRCFVFQPHGVPINYAPLQWIAALASLQQVTWRGHRTLPEGAYDLEDIIEPLATLPRLHTLALQLPAYDLLRSPELADLLGALGGRLLRLRLGVDFRPEEPSLPQELLAALTRLEVLDIRALFGAQAALMGPYGSWEVLVGQPLPGSLRRCHLGDQVPVGVLQQLREQHPLVAFKPHARPDSNVW